MRVGLANYVSDPAIVRADEHDRVITVLDEKHMRAYLRHLHPHFRWKGVKHNRYQSAFGDETAEVMGSNGAMIVLQDTKPKQTVRQDFDNV